MPIIRGARKVSRGFGVDGRRVVEVEAIWEMTEMRIWLLIPFTLFVAASAAAAQEVTAGGTAQAHAITFSCSCS